MNAQPAQQWDEMFRCTLWDGRGKTRGCARPYMTLMRIEGGTPSAPLHVTWEHISKRLRTCQASWSRTERARCDLSHLVL